MYPKLTLKLLFLENIYFWTFGVTFSTSFLCVLFWHFRHINEKLVTYTQRFKYSHNKDSDILAIWLRVGCVCVGGSAKCNDRQWQCKHKLAGRLGLPLPLCLFERLCFSRTGRRTGSYWMFDIYLTRLHRQTRTWKIAATGLSRRDSVSMIGIDPAAQRRRQEEWTTLELPSTFTPLEPPE